MPLPNIPTRLLISPGEPAGIGPDLVCMLAQNASDCELIAVADPALLEQRAKLLGLPLEIDLITLEDQRRTRPPGVLGVLPCKLEGKVIPGKPEIVNAPYVIDALDQAVDACVSGRADAFVTGPVNKAVLLDAGFDFAGHTEYLAQKTNTERVVMMLANQELRVVLATTHIPLADVSAAINYDDLLLTARIVLRDLQRKFGVDSPRLAVCGLNPHAGEGGHLGQEEIETIEPACNTLREEGFNVIGPLPADTAFTAESLKACDVVLAMYHDQGLPVIKHKGFGSTVNVTLGLPIIRTSVDHGTAFDLVGTGRADLGSLDTAIELAAAMSTHRIEV